MVKKNIKKQQNQEENTKKKEIGDVLCFVYMKQNVTTWILCKQNN